MKLQFYLPHFSNSTLFYVKEGTTPYLLQNNQKISSLSKNKDVFTLFDDNQNLTNLKVIKAPTFINPHGFVTLTQNPQSAIELSEPDKENGNFANNLTQNEVPLVKDDTLAPVISFGRPYTSLEAFILSLSAVVWIMAGVIGAFIGFVLIQKLITIFLSNKNRKEKLLSSIAYYALALVVFFIVAMAFSSLIQMLWPEALTAGKNVFAIT